MLDAPLHTASADDASPDERTQRHLRLLAELAEIGMELARALQRQTLAQAQAGEPIPADVGQTFSRIARAVRLTLALETRTLEGVNARREEVRFRALIAPPPANPRKDTVERVVEQLVEAERLGEFETEALVGALYERLDEDEARSGLADRPIGETIARICRDLGLSPDWSLWAGEDWVADAQTAPPPHDPLLPPWGSWPRSGLRGTETADPP